MSAVQGIRERFPAICLTEVPLSECCTWRIGGPAALLAEPRSPGELADLLGSVREEGLPWWLIGNGSNLLFPDEGLPGVVIRLAGEFRELQVREHVIHCGAAVPVGSLARRAAREGLSGLEFLVGIPALLGGALRMNAGAHGSETGNVVEAVQVLQADGSTSWLESEELDFSYRRCGALSESTALFARLCMNPGSAEQVRERTQACQKYRQETQPLRAWTCGSVFKRPGPELYPGKLIEEAGFKGQRCGDIEVSSVHANFFVNHGEGTAAQVLELVERVKEGVYEHSGVRLEEEFRCIEREHRP